MQNSNNNKNKTIDNEVSNHKNDDLPMFYVSPDKLELAVAYLVNEYERNFIDNIDKPTYVKLDHMKELYDSGLVTTIGVVRAKDCLSEKKDYQLQFDVKPYSTGKETIPFGPHGIQELARKVGDKRLSSVAMAHHLDIE